MADARIESLEARRLLYTGNGAVDFSDLVNLAENYGPPGYYSDWTKPLSIFARDWASAPTLTGGDDGLNNLSPFDTGVVSVRMSARGKLTATMGRYDMAKLRVKGASTIVSFMDSASPSTAPYERSIKGVRSIELFGSEKADSIQLGDGLRFTTVRSGPGKDTIRGSNGASDLYGGFDDDRIYGGGGDDQLCGGLGNDSLYGDTGNDRLEGGAGKDRLDGGKGRNKLNGGSGTDSLIVHIGKDKTDRDAKDRLRELS